MIQKQYLLKIIIILYNNNQKNCYNKSEGDSAITFAKYFYLGIAVCHVIAILNFYLIRPSKNVTM